MDVALCIQIRHTPYKQKNILQPFCVEMLMKMFGTKLVFFSPFFQWYVQFLNIVQMSTHLFMGNSFVMTIRVIELYRLHFISFVYEFSFFLKKSSNYQAISYSLSSCWPFFREGNSLAKLEGYYLILLI